ncbi:TPA: UbiX family flavin prenyltransferase [Candidatus Poribacteria bacterium]|nr:UbiX family flavin prenyltransferase [Candidatus Poribacteria bacterium]
MKKIIVAITGASGVIYAKRLLEILSQRDFEIHLTISEAGAVIIQNELDIEINLTNFQPESLIGVSTNNITYHHFSDIIAPISSGSYKTEGMAIVPCSMNTLGAITAGISNNLIQRAADVCIKERRNLVLVPRETPLSSIHLENMLKLSKLGVCILPAMPGFYHKPHTINEQVDFIVCKILDQFGIENDLIRRWE